MGSAVGSIIGHLLARHFQDENIPLDIRYLERVSTNRWHIILCQRHSTCADVGGYFGVQRCQYMAFFFIPAPQLLTPFVVDG
jgi:hypothetical protein